MRQLFKPEGLAYARPITASTVFVGGRSAGFVAHRLLALYSPTTCHAHSDKTNQDTLPCEVNKRYWTKRLCCILYTSQVKSQRRLIGFANQSCLDWICLIDLEIYLLSTLKSCYCNTTIVEKRPIWIHCTSPSVESVNVLSSTSSLPLTNQLSSSSAYTGEQLIIEHLSCDASAVDGLPAG